MINPADQISLKLGLREFESLQFGFFRENSEKLEPPHCENAMALDARISSLYGVNSDLGDWCAECVEACFYEALVRYGKRMTVEEVFDQVRRDKIFYDSSGGGVTVSGGEPLTHGDFVAELITLCRGEGIHTCVETCGCVPQAAFEKVLKLTDTFYFDLKIMDSGKHREYTGQGNDQILSNARFLAEKGADILFRQPLIPGVNSPEENVKATAAFIRSLGREDLALQLIPYHRMGTSKYAALDIPYTLEDMKPMAAEEVEAVRALYESCGVPCTVSK